MALLLALVAAFIELRTVYSIPFIRTAIEKFTVLGILFSVVLSVIIGSIFGAAGLVVMLGALIATTITQPVYMVASKIKQTGIDVKARVEEVKRIVSPFIGFFKLALYVMFLPFILIYKVMRWNSNRKAPRAVAA